MISSTRPSSKRPAPSQTQYDVIVIGGGASGMMAAATAARQHQKVLLLEKNQQLGQKLRISGGGRCNITNAESHPPTLLSYYGAARNFLYSAFAQFGVNDTFTFFTTIGVPLVIQARQRVFPQTERAGDVVAALTKLLRQRRVAVKTGITVMGIQAQQSRITRVVTNQGLLTADHYILATGGLSHPETGSTGDGFTWLKQLGHSITQPTPTIVPIAVKDAWVKQLAGISLPHVKITFYRDSAKQFSRTGTILCTHFGLSGPLILNCAGLVGDLLPQGAVTAKIDLYPDFDLGALEQNVVELFNQHKNQLIKTVLKQLAPPGSSQAIMSLIPAIDPQTKVHSITRSQRKQLVQRLKQLPVSITHLMGFNRAVVADGGVPLTEIDMRTMRSAKISNLSITGDLLHIQRPSGGYSLQLCWTTGYVAGNNIPSPTHQPHRHHTSSL